MKMHKTRCVWPAGDCDCGAVDTAVKKELTDNDLPKDRIGDAKARKAVPLCTGVFDYFPDALLAVAELSRIGNDQHNPGQDLHWARGKSGDECDALMRHLIDRGDIDGDGVRHSTKVAWRALANLQKELEECNGIPISRGSK